MSNVTVSPNVKTTIKPGDQILVEGYDDALTVIKVERKGRWDYVTAKAGTRKVTVTAQKVLEHHPVSPGHTKNMPPAPRGSLSGPATPRRKEGASVTEDAMGPLVVTTGFRKFREVHPVVKVGKHRHITNGDPVAVALTDWVEMGRDLYEIPLVKAAGLDPADLRAAYSHLNPGMQRMNVANRIRGAQHRAAR